MSKRTRNSVILAGIQTAVGTPAALTGAQAMLVRNITAKPLAVEQVSRDLIRPYFGNSQQLSATEHAELDFEVEIAGSGTPGVSPAWDPLIRAAAFAVTATVGTDVKYNPVTDGLEVATLTYWLDGILHKLTDARGTVSFDLTSKGIPVMKYHFVGAYTPIVDAARPTGIDFSNFLQPLVVGKRGTPTWAIFGYTGCLQSLTIDMAYSLTWRSLINCEGAEITDRKPAGNIALELPTIAAFDWPTKVRDAITGPLSITHGTTAGNIIKFDAPGAQMLEPSYSDQDGITNVTAGLAINPILGNDELVITVK